MENEKLYRWVKEIDWDAAMIFIVVIIGIVFTGAITYFGLSK